MLSDQVISSLRNQLASEWMHRGMALSATESPSSHAEAIYCFDEAVALRSTLPLAENPWFRYGLSAGWINRADVLARLGGGVHLDEAIASYDEALVLLRSLRLSENSLYARRLAITSINKGQALQKMSAANSAAEAVRCFEEAIGVLNEPASVDLPDRGLLQAGASANLAAAWFRDPDRSASKVRPAVQTALALTTRNARSDLLTAEIRLNAFHMLCRLTVQGLVSANPPPDDLAAEATDAADEGMELTRHWAATGETRLVGTARELFRFGCRIYQACRPRFLGEFILECVDPQKSSVVLKLDPVVRQAARAALWAAADQIQRGGFDFMVTAGRDDTLTRLRELRLVDERLDELVGR